MITVIEADADKAAVGGSRFGEPRELGRAARRRLLDQHMLAGRDGAVGDFRKRVVQCRDDDNGDGGIAYASFQSVTALQPGTVAASRSARSCAMSAQTTSRAPPTAFARFWPIKPQPTIATPAPLLTGRPIACFGHDR